VVVGDGDLAACVKTAVGHKSRFVNHKRILGEAIFSLPQVTRKVALDTQ